MYVCMYVCMSVWVYRPQENLSFHFPTSDGFIGSPPDVQKEPHSFERHTTPSCSSSSDMVGAERARCSIRQLPRAKTKREVPKIRWATAAAPTRIQAFAAAITTTRISPTACAASVLRYRLQHQPQHRRRRHQPQHRRRHRLRRPIAPISRKRDVQGHRNTKVCSGTPLCCMTSNTPTVGCTHKPL